MRRLYVAPICHPTNCKARLKVTVSHIAICVTIRFLGELRSNLPDLCSTCFCVIVRHDIVDMENIAMAVSPPVIQSKIDISVGLAIVVICKENSVQNYAPSSPLQKKQKKEEGKEEKIDDGIVPLDGKFVFYGKDCRIRRIFRSQRSNDFGEKECH